MNREDRVGQFERLKQQYGSFMEAIIWKLTGNEDLYLEALQFSLLEMWRHLAKLEGPQAGGYIYRIVQTACQKARAGRFGVSQAIPELQEAPNKSPYQAVQDKEIHELVRVTLTQLPGRQNQVIMMKYFQHMEYKEIAQHLDCNEQTARSHVSKGLKKLSRKLLHVKHNK
jgi:RNA polymerase sigma-70 factor (ECF subfamily)